MEISLDGQNVLVTGASRGIGRAIAVTLAEAGARVAIHYHHNKEAAETLATQIGHGATVFQADLHQTDECERLFSEVLSNFGGLSALVNNAGEFTESPLASTDWVAKWDQTMALNLKATGILCRQAVLHFQTQGNGRIVNIASRAAYRGETADYLAYAASKGGIVSLSKSIARSFGQDGVKCFVLAPGWVKTDMTKESIDRYGEDFVLQETAIKQLTQPENIAPLVAFLISGLADHATGTTIDINAGSYFH